MPKLRRWRAPRFWVLVLACLCGLSCAKTSSLNAVQGKVIYKSQPLAGALVSFHAEGAGLNVDPSVGMTKQDGTFSLTTGQTDGAAAGKYVVTIICPVPIKTKSEGMSFGGDPETEDRLQGAYANRDASQIKVTIKDGPNQLEPFDLK